MFATFSSRAVSLAILLLALTTTSGTASPLADLRIANWNIFNRPNSTQDFTDTQTILGAINAESINGFVDGLDVLALQETDTGSTQSQQKVSQILNGLGDGSFSSVTSSPSGGGDRTSIYYDTTELSLISSQIISSTNPSTRAQFRPLGTDGSFDFWVYSVHLTASSASTRTSEMATLRANADALGQDAEVLWVGDFNFFNSSEGGWQQIYAAGNAQGRDVADTPGSFSNNPAFLDLHTQDPRGQMDDRFDFQFGTTEVFDGEGFSYVDGSYTVFGNNGTHTFDQSITTGTGASASVLAALSRVSDHLPVVADYQIIESILLLGDVDLDGDIDASDIDLLYANLGSGDALYDLDLDGGVADQQDVDELVSAILMTEYGDANLDGKVDSADFSVVASAFGNAAGWATGDFSGDGVVGSADFSFISANFGFENAGAGPAPVPEPTTALLTLLAVAAAARRRR